MTRTTRSRRAGASLIVLMLVAGLLLVAASAGVTYLVLAEGTPPRRKTPAKGEAVQPDPAGLPVADAAGDPQSNSSRHAIIRMPAEWNDAPDNAKKQLDARFDAVVKKLKEVYGKRWNEHTVTLAPNASLKYRVFAQAVVSGRDHTVWRYNFACLKRAGDDEVRYLHFDLPGSGSAPVDRELDSVFLRVDRRPDGIEFVLNRVRVGRSTEEVIHRLRAAMATGDKLLLILDPDPELTVQHFIDVYNALVKVKLQLITLARPRSR